ncbi:hypothetical protein NZNM25_01520 [Nitrosopumilus zosterae]|uniref:Uncharacterized protein n=1 Tax=Nitrosopumilus zosterae TaxID=718286 RepID=A0A2S2KPB3_9ARCH|nr:hypothetical protein [Nitrosopumilus zosterae]BDQ31148.1 hypothetical protein NZOSNM25_001259 [Nitrosopumilus zosterae]GBH33361.1 hypothetical protein NZNM25_01520 [Nitrosopumilus zosterae]
MGKISNSYNMTKSSTYDNELFKSELLYYVKSMKKSDFKTSNILANRIMTNAWFFDNLNYGIVGFQLRQFALDALNSSRVNNTNGAKQVTSEASSFSDFIITQLSSGKFNLTELWTKFNIQREKYRKSLLPPEEKDVYPSNPDFTNATFSKILEILNRRKGDVTFVTNNLLKGILNELNRTARTYGTKINETYLWCLIIMLERVDDYIAITAVDKVDFEKRTREEILPLIEEVLKIFEKGADPDSVSKLLWKMIATWRESFIRFLEPRPNPQPSLQFTPQEQAKEEIIDEFVEGIEGELVKK